MLKKNQLILILLTLVLMLSVYYIRKPFDKDPDINNEPVVSTRLEELQAMRVVLNEERENKLLTLDAILANADKTVDEKNNAVMEKRYINTIIEKELLLETSIINTGYQDCFVHASEMGVEVTVISDNNDISKANEIIKMTLNSFSNITDDVSVSFQTAQEVMSKLNN